MIGHVIPAAGVEADKHRSTDGRNNGTGIATAALQLADRVDGPVDLVLLAVPAGAGRRTLGRIDAYDVLLDLQAAR